MNRLVTHAVGFVLGAVVAGAIVWMTMAADQREQAEYLDDVLLTKEAVENRAEETGVRVEAQQARIAELEDKLAAAESRIAAMEGEREVIADAVVEPTTEDTEDTEVDEVEEDADAELTLEEIRNRISGNTQARAQFRALTGLIFSDFLNGLELEAAAKQTLRDLLTDSQIEEIALQQYAARTDGVTGREYRQWIAEERARLSSEIQKLLSREDYEVWQEYQQTVDARALEVTFENQLRAFSSGLTPENHDLVVGVAIEEFIAEQNATAQSDEPYTVNEPWLYQLRAMDRMRERLGPALSEDQFGELDNWLTMGERVLNQAMDAEEDE